MKRYYYDLDIHSCLSPCGDDDMTVNNIAGMAKVNGLDIIALTDHNSTKNCAAFFAACEKNGVVPIAGVELTTAEDIHVICLFETLAQAAEFDEKLQDLRILFKNRPDVAGNQLILDGEDNEIGKEEFFLPNATRLSLEDAYTFASAFGAAVYPAHIDRPANGVVAVLGTYPDGLPFSAAEIKDKSLCARYAENYSALKNMVIVSSSDAHYLWDINEKENFFELECADNSDSIRRALLNKLRGE
jgi:hypothetical protein